MWSEEADRAYRLQGARELHAESRGRLEQEQLAQAQVERVLARALHALFSHQNRLCS